MAMPEYWDSTQVADFLGIEVNNLRQITLRMTRAHKAMGHKNDRCDHLLVSHSGAVYTGKPGRGKSYYRADKVRGYALYRKGHIDSLNAVVRATRDSRKRFG